MIGFRQWLHVGIRAKNWSVLWNQSSGRFSRHWVFLYCFVNRFDSHWKLPQLNGFSLGPENTWTTQLCHTLQKSPTDQSLQASIIVSPKPPWRTLQNYFQPLTLTDGTYWVFCAFSAPFSAIVPCILLAVIKLSLPFWLLFTLILKRQLLRHEHTRLFIQGHTRGQGPSQKLNILPDQSTHFLLVNTLSFTTLLCWLSKLH